MKEVKTQASTVKHNALLLIVIKAKEVYIRIIYKASVCVLMGRNSGFEENWKSNSDNIFGERKTIIRWC